MRSFPEGHLTCHKNKVQSKTYYKWYHVLPPNDQNGKRVQAYLRRSERGLAADLLKKKICIARLHIVQQELRAIDAYLKYAPTNTENPALSRLLNTPQCKELFDEETLALLLNTAWDFETLDPSKNRQRAATPDEALQRELAAWAAAPYQSNPYHPESKTIMTCDNILVRSKSEAIILTMLSMFGIPYRYEAPLEVGGHIKYPDFTIRHPITGEYFYWEHVGLLDNPSYRMDFFNKLRLYINNGILPDHNLILTYEYDDDAIDGIVVMNRIKECFL